MPSYLDLDVESVGRIALLFIDGDRLEDVLLDKHGHTDYEFGNFNALKKTLMKIERINPPLDLTAILWQLRPDNPDVAVPVVCGNALPMEGWRGTRPNAGMREALDGAACAVTQWDGYTSHYFAVRNSDGETVGALELLHGSRQKGDI